MRIVIYVNSIVRTKQIDYQGYWDKIADECAKFGSYIRCTGGGEPLLHPELPEMIKDAKEKGAKVWLNTNGSMFGPDSLGIERLEKIIDSGVDVIEFSMDAADAETYAKLRPPISGRDPRTNQERWLDQINNIRRALEIRNIKMKTKTNIFVSMIRQALGDVAKAENFWRNEIGVDNVITKVSVMDDNTTTIWESIDDLYDSNKTPQPIFQIYLRNGYLNV